MKERKAEILLELKNGLDSKKIISQGAEAKIYKIDYKNRVYILKERFKKSYRVDELDQTVGPSVLSPILNIKFKIVTAKAFPSRS